jgi:DNA polymerase-3 subunit alpha
LTAFAHTLQKTQLIVGHNIQFDLNIMGAEFLRKSPTPALPEGKEGSTKLSDSLKPEENERTEKVLPFGEDLGGSGNPLENIKWLDTKTESTDFVAIPGGKGGKFKWPTLTELHKKLFGEGFEDAHDAAYDVRATARCFFGLLQNKVVPTLDGTAVEEVVYEPPVLDEANFAKLRQKQEDILKVAQDRELTEILPFAHLHVHSQFSLLQSTAPVKYIVKKAKEAGMSAVAITDFGNMHAAFNATAYAADEGIKMIVGCEVFISEERKRNQFTKGQADKRTLAVLLAKHKEGYKNLSKLCSLGHIEGLYANYPRVDKDLIQQYSEGVIALIGGVESEIYNKILEEGEESAERALQWWIEVFKDDLYLEISRHGLEAQNYVNSVLVRLGRKYKVKYVATNNVFYLDKKDADAHDTLLAIRDGKAKNDEKWFERGLTDYIRGKRRFGLPNEEFYFKSTEEMNRLFADLPEAIETTQEIVDKCEAYKLKSNILMPKYEIPPEFADQDDYLRYLAFEGAKRHYGEPLRQDVIDRLDLELNVIKNMGFPGYFLIVQDFINAGRKMGVFVGPGRGSAAGSVVAYCTGITNIDPILYDLLFERFLNPERVSMPDIDIDFDDAGRQSVIDYVINKYGKNQVAQIITYGTMAAKMAIKDVARALELELAVSNQLAKYIPEKPGTKLKDAFTEIFELREILALKGDPRQKVLQDALTLEGSVRGTGIHAAGVIIAPQDLLDCIPVCTAKDSDLWVTQFDGKVIESAGMLKMDFLGLKTLTIIKDALELIKQNKGIEINIDKIPLDDLKTFELYQRGDTIGTFQFESEGMQMYLRQLKPTDIEDLIAMNSLYRPGPLAFIPLYIDRKHGREVVEYPHTLLESILSKTFGIMVYQEQIMQTAQIMAGYSLGGADLLRRAMGKKDKAEMDRQRQTFVKGSNETHNIPEAKANEVFDIMAKFAEYGFNRSHSAAYSVVAYQTAYLKANYPAEYMAAVLSHNMNIEKITFFLEECQKMGVQVLGPDVNESETGFSVNQTDQVRFGLAAIKGTGETTVENIISERKSKGRFKDVFEFSRRLNLRTVNKKSFESLAQAGAFDSFNLDRATYFQAGQDGMPFIEKLLKYGAAYQKDAESSQNSLFGGGAQAQIATPAIPKGEPWSKLEQLNREKEVVGFYISGHPLDQFRPALATFRVVPLDKIANFDRQEISVAGIISGKQTKQGNKGAFTVFTLEDYQSSLEIALFGKDQDTFADQVEVNDLVLIKGKVQMSYRGDRYELRIAQIQDLEALKGKHCQGLRVQIDIKLLNSELIGKLEALCQQYAGNLPMHLTVFDLEEKYYTELTSKKYRVALNDGLFRQLELLKMEAKLVY